MTITLHMIGANARLSEWQRFDSESRSRNSRASKSTDKVAAEIVAQITHADVIELIAREWNQFSSDLRVKISTLCNQRRDQPQSANQAKFVKKLDERLGGRLLRDQEVNVTMRDRRWVGGQMIVHDRVINPAVAGAQRAAQEQRQSSRKKCH